jgi:hypothetical protein
MGRVTAEGMKVLDTRYRVRDGSLIEHCKQLTESAGRTDCVRE